MNLIEFNGSENGKHECSSKREGDWVVYSCPECPDYQRKVNLKTGEMHSKCNEDNYNSHSGSYSKTGLGTGLYNPN